MTGKSIKHNAAQRWLAILLFLLPVMLSAQHEPFRFHKKLSTWGTEIWENIEMNAVAFSPDEKYLAAGNAMGNLLIWDTESGKLSRNLTDSAGGDVFYDIKFSPDGRYLVAAGTRYPHNAIKIWDTKGFRLIQTITYDTLRKYSRHTDGTRFPRTVSSVFFLPESHYMVSADLQGMIRVWNTGSWKLVSSLETEDVIWHLAGNREGNTLFTSTSEGLVKLWTIRKGNLQFSRVLRSIDETITSISISPDSNFITTNAPGQVKVINYETEKTIIETSSPRVIAADYSPDGRYLASGHEHNNVKIWDRHSYRLVQEIQGDLDNGEQNEHGFNTAYPLFSPGGRFMALSNDAGFIYLYTRKN